MNEKNIRWPNFLIVGAARAGTTSLHEFLDKHPDIYMSLRKEPTFFTFFPVDPKYKNARHKYYSTTEEYLKNFEGHNEQILGESSTAYLYFADRTIKAISSMIPDYKKTKILIILRDPAERAYSQYMNNRRDLLEQLSFEDAIRDEEYRKKENWHFDFYYTDKGFYYQQVKAYLENFDHVKVCLYEDLENDPQKLLSEIFEFLAVKPYREDLEIKVKNQGGEMKVKWFKKIITTRKNPVLNLIRKMLSRETKKRLRLRVKSLLLKYNLKKSDMDPRVKKELREIYRDDVKNLSVLINRNLDNWI